MQNLLERRKILDEIKLTIIVGGSISRVKLLERKLKEIEKNTKE